jgi:hypothetical protein
MSRSAIELASRHHRNLTSQRALDVVAGEPTPDALVVAAAQDPR